MIGMLIGIVIFIGIISAMKFVLDDLKHNKDIAELNLKFFSDFFHSPIKKSSFGSKKWVKGVYEGREVSLYYQWFDGSAPFKDFKLKPKNIHRKEKLICVSHPKPTLNTSLIEGEIHYVYPSDLSSPNSVVQWDEQRLIKTLDELVEAAKVVEQGLPYFN